MAELITMALFCGALIVCIIAGISIIPALLAGVVIFLAHGRLTGHTFTAMISKGFATMRAASIVVVTFVLIGLLTTLWRAAGTVSFIVTNTAGLVHPHVVVLLTFLLNCLMSLLTGSSFASAATMGVITMTLGTSMQVPPVKEAALEYGIEVYQPRRVREPECVEYLRSFDADIIVVVAFGQILPKEILEMPKYGCVNVHASLLPKYRGAAPIQWAVINGEKVSGVTTMRMDEGLDTGDMILKEEVVLDEKETGGSLFDRLSGVGARLCVRMLEAIEDGTAIYTKQDHAAATKTTLIKKQFGIIDWNKPAAEIECLIRGLNPWPSAYTYLNGKTLKIWAAAVKDETSDKEPGELTEVTKHSVGVQTGDGILMLEEVQLEGKKRMSADAFLRGNALSEGMKLGE